MFEPPYNRALLKTKPNQTKTPSEQKHVNPSSLLVLSSSQRNACYLKPP